MWVANHIIKKPATMFFKEMPKHLAFNISCQACVQDGAWPPCNRQSLPVYWKMVVLQSVWGLSTEGYIGPLVWTMVSFYHRSTGLIKPLLPFSARHTDLSCIYHPLKGFHYQIAEILWKHRKVPVGVGTELRRPMFHIVWQPENLNNLQGATGTFHTGGPLALW